MFGIQYYSTYTLGWNINFDYTNNSVGNRIKYDYRRMDKDAILYELSTGMLDWHSLFKGSVSDCWEVCYGSELYGNTYQTHLSKLHILNNKILRILQNKPRHTMLLNCIKPTILIPSMILMSSKS